MEFTEFCSAILIACPIYEFLFEMAFDNSHNKFHQNVILRNNGIN